MLIRISHDQTHYEVDLDDGIDLSIPLGQVNCFYAPPYQVRPHVDGDFIGSVLDGAPVNFFNVDLNPHGHGTHTECIGHITPQQESVLSAIKRFHFLAPLITIRPRRTIDGDRLIDRPMMAAKLQNEQGYKALIIRTLPNSQDKLTKDYSSTNPPYFTSEAMEYIVESGINHLLIDLPSVDREDDGGTVLCHKTFWQLYGERRRRATITELIYVPEDIADGLYFLNMQLAPIKLDATPSRPIIYPLRQITP